MIDHSTTYLRFWTVSLVSCQISFRQRIVKPTGDRGFIWPRPSLLFPPSPILENQSRLQVSSSSSSQIISPSAQSHSFVYRTIVFTTATTIIILLLLLVVVLIFIPPHYRILCDLLCVRRSRAIIIVVVTVVSITIPPAYHRTCITYISREDPGP